MHRIGTAGLTAVNTYLMANYDDDDAHQEHAEWILKDLWFYGVITSQRYT